MHSSFKQSDYTDGSRRTENSTYDETGEMTRTTSTMVYGEDHELHGCEETTVIDFAPEATPEEQPTEDSAENQDETEPELSSDLKKVTTTVFSRPEGSPDPQGWSQRKTVEELRGDDTVTKTETWLTVDDTTVKEEISVFDPEGNPVSVEKLEYYPSKVVKHRTITTYHESIRPSKDRNNRRFQRIGTLYSS